MNGTAPGRSRWAILGVGGVSRRFLLGLPALGGDVRVSVVASRDPANARRFAAEFAVPHAAEDYGAALASQDVDFVYVATPPSEHEAHALMAIAAGKPVLIEKPFAADAAAAARIAAAAREARVFCMEAMWTRFLPLIGEIRSRIAAGDLGEIRSFEGSFLGASTPDPAVSLFDPARGGGALMHRGVYPLSLARHFLGPIARVGASARLGATGVDEDCALAVTHASGAISMLRASLRSSGSNGFSIHGTEGRIDVAGPIWRPFAARLVRVPPRSGGGNSGEGRRFEALRDGSLVQGLEQRAGPLIGRMRGRDGRRLVRHYAGNGYHYEAAEVMRAAARGATESPVMPLDESVEIMAAIDAARADWNRQT